MGHYIPTPGIWKTCKASMRIRDTFSFAETSVMQHLLRAFWPNTNPAQ